MLGEQIIQQTEDSHLAATVLGHTTQCTHCVWGGIGGSLLSRSPRSQAHHGLPAQKSPTQPRVGDQQRRPRCALPTTSRCSSPAITQKLRSSSCEEKSEGARQEVSQEAPPHRPGAASKGPISHSPSTAAALVPTGCPFQGWPLPRAQPASPVSSSTSSVTLRAAVGAWAPCSTTGSFMFQP